MPGQPRRRAETGEPPAPGARGYAWPPFKPGHTLSMRHGAFSPRKVEPLAGELVERLLVQAEAAESPVGYLAAEEYRPAVWAWAMGAAVAGSLARCRAIGAEFGWR